MSEITSAEWTAILLSLRVAVIATLVATPFGIALALSAAGFISDGRGAAGLAAGAAAGFFSTDLGGGSGGGTCA